MTFYLTRAREGGDRFVVRKGTDKLYVRLMLSQIEVISPDVHGHTALGLVGRAEGADLSWTTGADRIGNSIFMGEACGVVEVDALAVEEGMEAHEVMKFGIKHLDPVLENFAVLAGIRAGLDIEICHTLRPHSSMLSNLYATKPKWGGKKSPFPFPLSLNARK